MAQVMSKKVKILEAYKAVSLKPKAIILNLDYIPYQGNIVRPKVGKSKSQKIERQKFKTSLLIFLIKQILDKIIIDLNLLNTLC